VTTSGDTQALPRIPVPGAIAGPLPTVALTIAVAAPGAGPDRAPVRAEKAPVRAENSPVEVVEEPPAAESHDRIYEEAMATIAALASSWSSTVQHTSGRHRAAA
jgi:hypothetical protein